MNPLLQQALASILRHLLSGPVSWLVARGIWPEDAASQYVAAFVGFAIAYGWSLAQKFRERQKLVTALASPRPQSETAVKTKIQEGQAPSVATHKNEIPVLQPKQEE